MPGDRRYTWPMSRCDRFLSHLLILWVTFPWLAAALPRSNVRQTLTIPGQHSQRVLRPNSVRNALPRASALPLGVPPVRPARQKKQQAERQEWLARLAARDVEPWPEAESDDEHAAALAKSRTMIDEVKNLLPGTRTVRDRALPVRLEHAAEQVGPYVAYLDRMYEWMCRLYGVSPEHKVWLGGKAPHLRLPRAGPIRGLRGQILSRSA